MSGQVCFEDFNVGDRVRTPARTITEPAWAGDTVQVDAEVTQTTRPTPPGVSSQ